MQISASMVKELREKTGVGMMQCKKALVETQGDLDAAAQALRKQGLLKAEVKASRTAREGIIAQAIAPGARAGVLVEINCETDFVARTPDFQQFVHDVAMQVVATVQAGRDVAQRERGVVVEVVPSTASGEMAVAALESPASPLRQVVTCGECHRRQPRYASAWHGRSA